MRHHDVNDQILGQKIEIKSLYSRYYAEACNKWRAPSLHLSAWVTQLRRNVVAMATLYPIGPGQESNRRPPTPIAMSCPLR